MFWYAETKAIIIINETRALFSCLCYENAHSALSNGAENDPGDEERERRRARLYLAVRVNVMRVESGWVAFVACAADACIYINDKVAEVDIASFHAVKWLTMFFILSHNVTHGRCNYI